jgi:Concanavalin A-like lectin/glucanases superfamily
VLSVRNDEQRTSDPLVQFVWEAPGGTAEASQGTAGQRRVLRRRALLIGSGALVLLAGAVYGAVALGAQQHHAGARAAAAMPPSPLSSAQGAVSSLPTSPSPNLSQSATPASQAAIAAPEDPAAAPHQQPSAAHRQPSTGTNTSPAAVGDWPLTVPASGSGSVVDIAGSHPGTASDVQWGAAAGVGSYGVFNGTNSLITTFGPVVDTGPGSSYTVSAWLYPVQYDTSAFMTAVSQDGGPDGDSGFYLSFSGPIDRWVFLVPGASAPAGSTDAPALDTWTHLVGVYDAADDQVRLYVDGTLDGTATYDSAYAGSNGSLVIGRAMYAGGLADWFHGDIRDVEVFDQALSASAVESLG